MWRATWSRIAASTASCAPCRGCWIARPDVRVIVVGGDGVSYGARLAAGHAGARLQARAAGRLDLSRVHFVGELDYDSYVELLQRSDAHVYLTYPFVASWSLREALASGCALVGSDTGAGAASSYGTTRPGCSVSFHDPEALADGVLEMLENRALVAAPATGAARQDAERPCRWATTCSSYEALIERTIAAA